MNILVNYADENYEAARRWNTRTGKWFGHFEKIYEFKPEDIDTVFKQEHSDIFSYKRGNGLWLWKPYFIEKVIRESQDGDFVFYIDSGAFFIHDPRVLKEYINENEPIFACDQPLIESCWTKPECFDKMNGWAFANNNQFLGGLQVILVNRFTRSFYKEWLALCCRHELISPAGLGKFDRIDKQYGNNFVAHREDQSIFSLLCHRYGIKAHRDISQRGFDPMSYYNSNYAYRVAEHKSDTYPSILFLHKSPRIISKQFVKQLIRCLKENIIGKIRGWNS